MRELVRTPLLQRRTGAIKEVYSGTVNLVSPPASHGRDDVVGDREKLLGIGFFAVSGACAVFAAFRLGAELLTGRATPWWGNAAATVALSILYGWYRGDRAGRSSAAVHGLAARIAMIVMVVPAAYGMTSSKWWLALVGFSVLLMGRRSEAIVWTALTALFMSVTAVVEPLIALPGASAEPAAEQALSGVLLRHDPPWDHLGVPARDAAAGS